MSDFNLYKLSYCPFGKTNTIHNLTRHLIWMIPNDLYIWKLTCLCVFLNKREVLSRFFGKSNIFKYFFHVPHTFLWLFNYERYVHVCVSFRCIFLICSCHLIKHPSLCELFWCTSPDDGYWNRNVWRRLHIIINSPIWIMFFLLPSYYFI